MKQKRISLFFLGIILFSLCPIIEIKASTQIAYVTENHIFYTKKPNIESPTSDDFVAYNVLQYLDKGDEVKLIGNSVPSTIGSCQTKFYEVGYQFANTGKYYTGYVCGDYLKFEVDVTPYIEEFTKAGFPKSYWSSLALIKEEHPNWVLNAYQTNLDWKDVLDNETAIGKSLLHYYYSENGGYLDTSSEAYNYKNNTWYSFDGGGPWYAANRQTIAYYIDPRNFLTEISIFMFENLSYKPESQTQEIVEQVLGSDFLKQYAPAFMKAAETYHVSPVYLAARVRQEIGTTPSVATNGEAFEYNGKTYSGLYNFYNYGATSGENNWKNGLIWANGGENQENKTFGRPWNTAEKSIIGGAGIITNNYIDRGQDTIYYQKWNVVTSNPFTNQYMTNIMAPVGEAYNVFKSYNSLGLIQTGEEGTSFTFTIPVYKNMPEEKSTLPTSGNPNNYLNAITINDKVIDQFNIDQLNYTYYTTVSKVKLGATAVSSTSQISGLGEISLKEKETKVVITVTAENGSQRQYTITFIRTDNGEVSIPDIISSAGFRIEEQYISKFKLNQTIESVKTNLLKSNDSIQITITDSNGTVKKDDAMIGTGDIIKITVRDTTETYQALVYGDVNGDGKLDLTDILYLQRHYLKVDGGQLVGIYYKSTDVDRNGNIDLTDLLQFQRQYLKIAPITQ